MPECLDSGSYTIVACVISPECLIACIIFPTEAESFSLSPLSPARSYAVRCSLADTQRMPKSCACPPAAYKRENARVNGLPQVIVAAVLEAVDSTYMGTVRLQTLATACRVSKDWYRIARRCLYGRLLVCLRSPPTHANFSFALLSALLGNRRLAGLVCELILHLDNASAVAAAAVFTLFQDFTKLRRLSLSTTQSKAAAVASHLKLLPALQELAITGEYSKTFVDAVYRLPRLASLQLSSYPGPDSRHQPTFELHDLIADVELAPKTFYKLTMISCETLTKLILTISDIMPPVDISFLVQLRSLSFIAPAEPLSKDVYGDIEIEEEDGPEEHAGGQWMLEVVKSAKNLSRLTFLSLRCADGATVEMWEDLPYVAIDFLHNLPRSIEVLDLSTVNYAFYAEDVEDLLLDAKARLPALHTVYLGILSPWLFSLCLGLFDLRVRGMQAGVSVLFQEACSPVLRAAVCTF